MSIFKKSWQYQNGSDGIVVNYDYNFSFKNHFCKTVKINNEIIFQTYYSCFYIQSQKDCIFEKNNLKIFLGKHLGFFRRCHIYVTDKLVGGDVEKQICISKFSWA